jgi:type IV pilus assembly protein PilN
MAKINLLPWRAERRKQRQKEFMNMLGLAALVGVLVSFLIVMYYEAQISGQNARNAYLQEQIRIVDQQIEEIKLLEQKRADLQERQKVIEQLQARRSLMVHLFDELVRTIPDGVRLRGIKQAGDKLTLQGVAQSNARVSTYMRNLDASAWLKEPNLLWIRAAQGEPGLPFSFELEINLEDPNAPATDENGEPVEADTALPTASAPAGAAQPAAAPATAPGTTPAAPAPAGTAPAAAPAQSAPATAPPANPAPAGSSGNGQGGSQ